MNTSKKFTGFEIITVGFMVAWCAQPAHAGWSGAMNGIGYGQATVNVRAYDTLTSKTRYVTTTNMLSPSAAITITDGYVFGARLPQDASPATVAKVKGLPGFIWQATTVGSDGDSTDNIELESRVTITAADCAALEMSSSAVFNPGDTNGMMIIYAKATAGAAFWTRGIELVGDFGPFPTNTQPIYDENGDFIGGGDEFKEFLKANGKLKWDVLYVGPFDLSDECSAIKIPFNIETDKTNLFFFTDGIAKSLPLVIECPSDIVGECGTPVQYPETLLVGGCGDITVTFDPATPPASVGTHLVTVTASDTNGNTASCTFNVTIEDTTKPVQPSLVDVITVGECTGTSVTPPTPTTTDACAGTVTGKTTTVFPITTIGTTVVTWTFTDAAGNETTATQNVIVDSPTLTFDGFYSPINGTGGSCGSPIRTVKLGSKIPIKWKTFCGGVSQGGGTPTFNVTKCDGTPVAGGQAQFVANEWHANFETSQVGVGAGDYTITVTLQDGITKKSAVIRLK